MQNKHLSYSIQLSSRTSEQNGLEFSAANLALAGFPQTDALGESMPSRH